MARLRYFQKHGVCYLISPKDLLITREGTQEVSNKKVSPQRASASSSSSSPGVVVNSSAKRANPKQKGWNSGPVRVPLVVPAQAQARGPPQGRTSLFNGSGTFWTICLKCKMHYEYYKVYLNRTVLCLNCRKPFHAVELPAPVNRYNNMDIRFSRSVRGSAAPSGASNAASFINGSKSGCEESNGQRVAKRRPNVEFSYPRSAWN